MRVEVEEVLRFFDERPLESVGHATALVAVAGEDLGIGLFCHYMERNGKKAEAKYIPCTTGKKCGPRLDCWIEVGGASRRTLYQVEIKNWSAHAIGGKPLPVSASPQEIAEYKRDHWRKAWDRSRRNFRHPKLRKVLAEMRRPEGYQTHKHAPLVCYWSAMHPAGDNEPFFSQTTPGRWCTRVSVFSMSAYLRNLRSAGVRRIEIGMPRAGDRMNWLKTIFSTSR